MGKKAKLQNNSGFSMITVILALAFVGIIAMLVIYLVMANLSMKMSNKREKDGFYTAERVLTEIKTGLQQDVAEAMSESYTAVMETYQKSGEKTEDETEEMTMDQRRKNAYKKKFLICLEQRLTQSGQHQVYDLRKLRSYVDLKKDINTDKESLVITTTGAERQAIMQIKEDEIILKNLRVVYVDEKGYAAIIKTDIALGIPMISFPTPSTLPDLMSMVVIANKGIVCENAEETVDNQIQGSFYAGLLPEDKKGLNKKDTSIYLKAGGSKLSISKSERAVCAGEIAVGKNSSFSSAGENNLWAQGLHLASSSVSLEGKTYMSDDLTVDAGAGSNVSISGEYYGYGALKSATSDKSYYKSFYQKKNMKLADISSAITINGKNTTLNVSGLTRLMLAGKNYVSSSILSTKLANQDNNYENNNDVLTGESLTVKGTQLAYLVPDSLLGEDGQKYYNPMTYTQYEALAKEDKNFSMPVKKNTAVKELGGKSLSEIGVDADKPIQTVFYADASADGGGFVYFYLNFTDEKKASDFMNSYYNNNPKLKKAMDDYLAFYFGNEGTGIHIKNPSSYLRYVVNGNVLAYDSKTKSGNIYTAPDVDEDKVLEEQVSYQNMWYALRHKMLGSYDLLKKEVKEDDGLTHDETDLNRSVFDNIVNEKKLVQFIEEKHPDTKQYKFSASSGNGGLETIIAHNGKSSTFKVKEANGTKEKTVEGSDTTLNITSDMADKLRLVVCTGDVTIEKNVTFYGIIMAGGTITLQSGAKVISSPLEAAKAFQSQVSTDNISPKDFFFEGDKYVLGNSTTSNDGKEDEDSDIYQVEKYINFKNWKRM